MKQFFKENKDSVVLYSVVAVIGIAAYFLFLKFDSFWNGIRFITSIFTPFFVGFVIAYLLNPLMKLLEEKVFFGIRFPKNPQRADKLRRLLSMLLIYVLLFGVIVCLTLLLIPQIGNSVETLLKNIPSYMETMSKKVTPWIEFYHLNNAWFEQVLPYHTLVEYATVILNACFGWLVQLPRLLASGFTNILLGIVISVYFLYDKERFLRGIKKTLQALVHPKSSERILEISKITDKTFSQFFLGKIIDSAIIGIIAFPFMLIIYRPYALLISVIIGVTNVIPFFGPFIGAVPSGLLILFVAPDRLLWFIIFVLLLQQFDGNILGPKILGGTTGLSPTWVMFGILAGSKLLGFWGMIVGVPFTAVAYLLFRNYIEKKYQEKYQDEYDACQPD